MIKTLATELKNLPNFQKIDENEEWGNKAGTIKWGQGRPKRILKSLTVIMSQITRWVKKMVKEAMSQKAKLTDNQKHKTSILWF